LGKNLPGDAKAFDAFYRAHGPKLELFLRRILRDLQAAEDVMQETFTQIWQRPNGFDHQRGTLRAYLFGVGRKKAAERH
jgi:RNA polymerase sigma-70 factor, ECF subfamily